MRKSMRFAGRIARIALVLLAGIWCWSVAVASTPDAGSPAQAKDLMQQGQWKDAYAMLAQLAADSSLGGQVGAQVVQQGVECLQRLGEIDQLDGFLEKAVTAHASDPSILMSVSAAFLAANHEGSIVAGQFVRGPHRGGTARYVDSYERDRIRALQILHQGMNTLASQSDTSLSGRYNAQMAQTLITGRFGQEAWRLQALTDIATLPDFDDPSVAYQSYGWSGRGAPVDAKGNPVFHRLPESWDSATSDGQRWRWCLAQAETIDPQLRPQIQRKLADFFHDQFGVQTMQTWGRLFGRQADDEKKDQSGPYALRTLADDETIARLAAGIRRFKLPAEVDFIRIYRELAEGGDSSAAEMLGQIYEDRQQYSKAADWWRRAGKTDRVGQIEDPWGTFEPIGVQCAGAGAKMDFRFRNATKVSFVAAQIQVERLLEDCKNHLRSHPAQLNSYLLNFPGIGYALMQKKCREYLGKKVAAWDLQLDPRADHFDRRITVTTPLSQAGAYLLAAHVEGGNTSYLVLWVNDLAIVKKQLDQKILYYVTDARTGQPIPGAKLDFFGYSELWNYNGPGGKPGYVLHVQEKSMTAGDDGQILTGESDLSSQYQWLVTARDTAGRMGWLGWTNQSIATWYDQEYNETKSFFMSDRPVYRPGQTVKFKFWLNQTQYDREGRSPMAGRRIAFRLTDPRGQQSDAGAQTADDYGGADGEWHIPTDATLGVYSISTMDGSGSGTFRVEEYKKPEFEVTVDAPKEPVALGESFDAKIQARYLFGAPVKEGRVKYKVVHSEQEASWYPTAPWDWFYGPGYWWFGLDYEWYPGWSLWGCRRPVPSWIWGGRWGPVQQPDVVAENEVDIGSDGTVSVHIDTALAKATQGDTDHSYAITAEVTDRSRRTITGSSSVIVARVPFKVYAWVDHGHYRVGDTVLSEFHARTADGKPVTGSGTLKLLKLSYTPDGKPVESPVQTWTLSTDVDGMAHQPIKASEQGQYRLSYTLADAKGHVAEGGYVFVIAGDGVEGSDFRYNDLELVADQKEYQPGDHVRLRVNTNRRDATVLLFARASNGVCLPPTTLKLKGKSVLQEIEVTKKDMPNFFVEALTVSDGQVHDVALEIAVPPESRILHVDVQPAAPKVKPGQKTRVTVRLTDSGGKPYQGSAVVTMYDKALEYISGGSNVGDIREVFWKWRRTHQPAHEDNLSLWSENLIREGDTAMQFLGCFGHLVADMDQERSGGRDGGSVRKKMGMLRRGRPEMMEARAAAPAMLEEPAPGAAPSPMSPMAGGLANAMGMLKASDAVAGDVAMGGGNPPPSVVQPVVRTNFADTAFWNAALTFDATGCATIDVPMPESLTTWKTKVWVAGDGARVGQGEAEVITTKNLIIRLQAPRFFVEKDEVVLSANVHNYLSSKKSVRVVLELEGGTLALAGGAPAERTVEIDAGGETRVDWRVSVLREGKATVRMKALTDEESDATQMELPCKVHGMLKTESFCGVLRPSVESATVKIKVPAERNPEQSRLEVRYSPTLAGAMVDALPYLVEYPYGCTEQTLDRFLPTVIAKKALVDMGVSLKDVQDKITNLNAQEIGDDAKRAADWKRLAGTERWNGTGWEPRNPVFDEVEVHSMIKAGLSRLVSMQCGDGGWGWFSGWGEQSYPHTTALVVHGLQVAQYDDVAIPPGVLDRGVAWLMGYQAEELRLLQLPVTDVHHKSKADALDALVYKVLVDARKDDPQMREMLYRDRNDLPVYAKCLVGLAVQKVGDIEKRDMLLRNIEQYLVQDNENQTAYLKLPENDWWWCWYGSEFEADASYLELLTAVDPKGEKASRLVKYLLNNRRNATYWNSTRDTALVVEAFADYMHRSGETKPDMQIEVLVDGHTAKKVLVTSANEMSFDNKLVIEGPALTSGEHTLTIRRTGTGPVYWNAYLTNFTKEDQITRAGLEVKVNRKVYKLIREEKAVKAQGDRGQVLDQKVDKYRREEVSNLATLKSGDLVEVELVIDSKNDYEYVLVEDMKAAGFEPVEVRSGYNGNDMGAYVEFHDDRVSFFVRQLARGQHSVSYRLRAEIPGRFSALPAKAWAMYAPELKANSDEIKLAIQD